MLQLESVFFLVNPYLEHLVSTISVVTNKHEVWAKAKLEVTRHDLVTYRLDSRRLSPLRRGYEDWRVCTEDLVTLVSS